MTNDILKDLEYVDEGGALMYSGVRYMLIRPETVIEFQKAVEDEIGPEKIGQILYRAGYRGGTLSAAHFREELALPSEEIVRFMANMGGQLGWGRMEITSMRPDRGTLELEVFHSAFAEAFGKADSPVCHMIRGVFAGTWGGAIDQEVEGLETRCRAVDGPGPCTFIFAPLSQRGKLNVSFCPPCRLRRGARPPE